MADEEKPYVSGRQFLSGKMTNEDVKRALSLGAQGAVQDNAVVQEMAKNRRINAKAARNDHTAATTPSAGAVSFATSRPKDPLFYWKQNNLPYDVAREEDLKHVRAYCRLLYLTHPVIASAVDIYSKYPLTGMELRCKDPALTDFYSELFFDRLDYEEFLIDLGREYWTAGEAWPLGTWNELLGIWEQDELMNPDDIWVIRSPFLKEPRFEMRLPKVIREILTNRQPQWEYERLLTEYPEFINFLHETARIPVSNVILKQIRFKGDTFSPRGVPILMRGFRSIMQEEMINAAVDAVADRLYTPLIVAKLGASATDLGTDSPWIPTDDDLAEFEGNLDAALAADFRVLIHNFALDMEVPLGRELMPRVDEDMERLEGRILQVFGLSQTMLSGASSGETYAADALNRDLISQLLTTYQRRMQKFYKERALIVAEAQEHFDYEERGGKRYVINEEVLEVDEGGNQRIVEKPKLLVPDLQIRAMNMQDDESFRGLVEQLRGSGIPISMRTRLINIPIDLDEEREQWMEEEVQRAVDTQEIRKKQYIALRDAGLPIPEDLQKDFTPMATPGQEGEDAATQATPASGPVPDPSNPFNTSPMAVIPPPEETAVMDQMAQGGVGPDGDALSGPPEDPGSDEGGGSLNSLPRSKARPPESDEQRSSMPKKTTVKVATASMENGEEKIIEEEKKVDIPHRMQTPFHVGARAARVKQDENGTR